LRTRRYAILQSVMCICIVLVFVSCGWRAEDRCWIDKAKYEQARELYLSTASLEIVKESLEDAHWTTPQINEAVYRLKKEFHLEATDMPIPE